MKIKFRQPRGPQLHAAQQIGIMGIANDNLKATPSDIDNEIVRLSQIGGVANGQIDQPGLLFRADHAQIQAELLAHPADKLAAVFRFPHRAGRHGPQSADAFEMGHFHETFKRRQTIVHGPRGQHVLGKSPFAQLHHLLVLAENSKIAVRRDLGHYQMDAVGSDIDGPDRCYGGLA